MDIDCLSLPPQPSSPEQTPAMSQPSSSLFSFLLFNFIFLLCRPLMALILIIVVFATLIKYIHSRGFALIWSLINSTLGQLYNYILLVLFFIVGWFPDQGTPQKTSPYSQHSFLFLPLTFSISLLNGARQFINFAFKRGALFYHVLGLDYFYTHSPSSSAMRLSLIDSGNRSGRHNRRNIFYSINASQRSFLLNLSYMFTIFVTCSTFICGTQAKLNDVEAKTETGESSCPVLFDRPGHFTQGCVRKLSIEEATDVFIERPNNTSCDLCVVHVEAKELSHYLKVELKIVQVPDAIGNSAMFDCHTCFCGLLSIYDNEYIIGEWCYGRVSTRYLTSSSRSLSFVYRADEDSSRPHTTFSFKVTPVGESRTKIISVERDSNEVKSGVITSDGFPTRGFYAGAGGQRTWLFINNRPNTTMRLKMNDLFLVEPIVGFCFDFVNVFDGTPQVMSTWYAMLCGRDLPDDFYFPSKVVSVVFNPDKYGSVPSLTHGFNMTYTFFNRNVTAPKHFDCGEFNSTAYGQGVALPPVGDKNANNSSGSPMIKLDLRCHWRLVIPEPYASVLVTITNFSAVPSARAHSGKSMQELIADERPLKYDSPEWSVELRDPVSLTVYDGIYSSSDILVELTAQNLSHRVQKPVFYLSSGNQLRIEVTYPNLGSPGVSFAYAAIRFPVNKQDCEWETEFLCPAVEPGLVKLGDMDGSTMGRYCIRKELICDGFPNCLGGNDEINCELYQRRTGKDKSSKFVTYAVGVGVAVVLLVVIVPVLIVLSKCYCRQSFTRVPHPSSLGGDENDNEGGTGMRNNNRFDLNNSPLASSNPTQLDPFSSSGLSSNANRNEGSGNGAGGRSSRHNSGDSNNPNSSSAVVSPQHLSLSSQPPQITEHDPHVTPQPIFIARIPHEPPLYDLVFPGNGRPLLTSVDEEVEYGANNSNHDDREFLLRASGKNSNSNS